MQKAEVFGNSQVLQLPNSNPREVLREFLAVDQHFPKLGLLVETEVQKLKHKHHTYPPVQQHVRHKKLCVRDYRILIENWMETGRYLPAAYSLGTN